MSSADELITSYGDLAMRWTVRVALLGYFVGGAMRLGRRSAGQELAARLVWTMGCLFYLAHVACAFHFIHHWSHASAYQHTAERTSAVTGWNWGGGIYFNYLFTAVWLSDVIALWLRPSHSSLLPAFALVATQAFLWFMVFNATVVFGHGVVRWCGLIGCGWLLALAVQRFARRDARR